MKKISYILTTYPCRSETFIRREMMQLERQGFEIGVFASGGRTGDPVPTQDLVVYYRPSVFSLSAVGSIIYAILRHPVRLVKFIIYMVKLLAICPGEAKTALVNFHTICFFARMAEKQHSQHIHACFLSWPACIGLGVSTLTELPFSISAHARDIFVESGAVGLKAQKADFFTCCTKQGLDYLKNKIDSVYHHKLLLNYHGIEPNPFLEKFNDQREAPSEIVIAVGRLVEKKGFACLLEAFRQVIRKRLDTVLVIAGDGPQKSHLQRTVEQLGLQNRVHLVGWLEHARILEMIRQSKMLVVPSIIDADGDRDGLPNVILEAFSVGTPVIASDLSGIGEAVVHEKTGLLVRAGDPVQLAVAIERLLVDERLCNLLAANAKETLAEKFNLEKNGFALAGLFENKNPLVKDKIKIAHIIEGFVGGMSTYLCHVLISLQETGFDVTLIYSPGRCDTGSAEKIDRLKEQGIKVRTIPMTRPVNPVIDLYCLFVLIKIFNREKFDMIHTHCSKAGALGRMAARFSGINKTYHSSHCFAFLRCGNFLTKKIYLFIERRLAGFTTKFIAVSGSDAESAKKWKIFDEDQCVIVNNGLPAEKKSQASDPESIYKIRKSFNLPSETAVVVTACRLVEYKGLFTFLEAARLSKSNAIFVIAGDGPLRKKVEKYISMNNLSEKVRLLGHICNMDRLYRICELVVLCSKREAQPYLILEAMRANRTVIASDVAGNTELLTGGRGLLVKTSHGCIAMAVDYMLRDSQQRFQFAQNAYEYFHSRHRLEDQVQRLGCIYLDNDDVKERACNSAEYRRAKICSEND